MTTAEVRKMIAKSTDPDWFKNLDVEITFSGVGFSQKFVGIASLHQFLSKQTKGWSKYEDIPNQLNLSKTHFDSLLDRLESFLTIGTSWTRNELANRWRNEHHVFVKNDRYLTYDSPYTLFLLKIHKTYPDSFAAAFDFIHGAIRIGNKSQFIGAVLAYEFETNGDTEITSRKEKEAASIQETANNLAELSNEFEKRLGTTEIELNKHLRASEVSFGSHVEKLGALKDAKEVEFNNWFEGTEEVLGAKVKISELENTYQELLRLKKPAEYWNKRAATMKSEGWRSIKWLVGLVIFTCITLYALLWLTPEGMLLSFVKGNAQAIKWSVIYVTFISFLAFGIRALNKIAFSSFHLARDAEEREQLTYLYLSLMKESAVEDSDRNLILQSLFSRADTGLLKDDSGPTMPNDIAGKVFSAK
jgi:hypothetical protein